MGGPRLPFYVAAGIAGLDAVVAIKRLPETRPETRTWDTTVRARLPLVNRWATLSFEIAAPAVVTVMLIGLVQRLRSDLRLVRPATVGLRPGRHRGGLRHGGRGRRRGARRSGPASGGAHRRPRVPAGGTGRRVLRASRSLPTVHARVELSSSPSCCVTAGQSLSTPALTALVVARVDAEGRGAALGAQQGLSSLARIVGPAVGGLSYELLGVGSPFFEGGLVIAAALVFSLVMRSDRTTSTRMVGEPSTHRLPLSN